MAQPRPQFARRRRIAGFTQESLAAELDVDRSTVGRWESGQTEPQPPLRRKLAAALGVTPARLAELLAGDQVAKPGNPLAAVTQHADQLEPAPAAQPVTQRGFTVQPAAGTVKHSPNEVDGGDDVERKAFLRALAGSAAGLVFSDPITEFLASTVNDHGSRRIGMAEVVQVRSMARSFANQDHGFVGGLSAEAVVAQLGITANLLEGQFSSEPVRQQLFSAVAELADVAGGMCFDAAASKQAERCFRFAVACATEGTDWAMRAKALSGLANLAVHSNRGDDALSMAEMALVRADRLTPVTRAVMHTRHARALGLNGHSRQTDCLHAADAAQHYFAAGSGDEPEWIAYYTPAHLERDLGRALLHLAVNGGEFAPAQTHLQAAVASFPRGQSRGKTLALANLAHVTMARDDPNYAVTLGHQAVDAATSVRSDRVFESLRQVRAASQQHGKRADVAELNNRIDGVLRGRANG